MTKGTDRSAIAQDQELEDPPRDPDGTLELDAEMVRDLELDSQAHDVRGGCKTTNATCGHSAGGF